MSSSTLFDLSGKTAVVTAAAGGGFGRQISDGLADAGARLIVTSRDQEKAEARAAELRARGTEALGHGLDIGSESSVNAFTDWLAGQGVGIDVLVNNAGTNHLEPFERVSVRDWNRVLETNITGTMLVTRALAPVMLENGGGAIINISSIYGVVGPDHRIYGGSGVNTPLVYGATKAAILQMTRFWATYWAPAIRVNSITPGGLYSEQDPEFVRQYSLRTPLGRMAGPNDLKGAAVFLSSSASAWMTGQNLVVDGGWTTW